MQEDEVNSNLTKERDRMKLLSSFSILALIWSIYYLAMHITGDILSTTDIVVYGAVIVFCVIIIAIYLCKFRKKK